MDISKIAIGQNPPENVNVIVEIPLGGQPVKYEMDKESGALLVNRFWQTSMVYPANYGFIPHTLSADGDPCDALVIGPAVVSSAVVRCRPVGALLMQDESGEDEKIIMVPSNESCPYYARVESYHDLPPGLCDQITHFFQHYKDLEKGRWVKISGWAGPKEAAALILAAVARAQENP
jgi:inorganic pyrophosphatase